MDRKDTLREIVGMTKLAPLQLSEHTFSHLFALESAKYRARFFERAENRYPTLRLSGITSHLEA